MGILSDLNLQDIGTGFLASGFVPSASVDAMFGAAIRHDNNPMRAGLEGLGVDALAGSAIAAGAAGAAGSAGAADSAAPATVDSGAVGAGTVAGGVTPLAGAEAPASTSSMLANGLVEGGGTESATATAPAAIDSSMGMNFTPGPGGAGPLQPEAPGMLSQAGDWVQTHPIASLIGANMAGGALSGIAQRSAMLEAEKKRRERELELADLPRKTKQGNQSVGGRGININLKPGNTILYRPDGTPVYRPGTGIINGAMNGVRG